MVNRRNFFKSAIAAGDRRTRELENRRDAELKRLEAAIAAIR